MGWDVFISHASEDKATVAVPLKNELEALGMSVWIDIEQIKLGDGFRARIEKGLQQCKFGVVILSPRFFEKPWAGAELDAFLNMEMSASERKLLLPVVVDMSFEELKARSPLVATRRAVLWRDGIDAVVAAIAEVVSGGGTYSTAASPKAPSSHSVSGADALIFFMMKDGRTSYAEIVEVESSARQLNVTIKCIDPAETAFVRELGRNKGQPIQVAYDTIAISGTVEDARLQNTGSNQVGIFVIRDETPKGGNPMEMSYGGKSADQLAEMRVRRILLDETSGVTKAGSKVDAINQAFLDTFVSGQEGPIKVKQSPFPILYRQFHTKPELFLSLARLAAVMYLCLSNAVQDVLRLDLTLEGALLKVDFSGRRARRFSNVDPPLIHVKGSVDLSASTS